MVSIFIIMKMARLRKNNIIRWVSERKHGKNLMKKEYLLLVIAYKNDVEVSINGVKIKLPESDTKLIK